MEVSHYGLLPRMEKEHIPTALIGALAGAVVSAVGFAVFQDAMPPVSHVFSGAVTGAMLAWMYRAS